MTQIQPDMTTPEPGDRRTHESADVAILGGGLAGLTLALQLSQLDADKPRNIVVLERKSVPKPLTDHKVGESTVEIGANYFGDVLGLKPYLNDKQLRKFGLRYFFSEAAGHPPIDQVAEIGTSSYLPQPSYQLDRVRFENDLAEMVAAKGVRIVANSRVRSVDVADNSLHDQGTHTITYAQGGQDHVLHCRWLVDATGRAGTVKRAKGKERVNQHQSHALWFRVPATINIDQWSDNAAWQARMGDRGRLLSTNHMMGEGYWAWIIPLAGGDTSIGLVADPAVHDIAGFSSIEHAQAWFEAHEPSLARQLAPHMAQATGYKRLKNYSHDCAQVFSSERWAITGEAGLFLDPFYSPGSDFIAISNCYITDLIQRDQRGERWAARAGLYDQLYASFYASTLELYQNQMPAYGQPRVMAAKITWDFYYYWAVLALLFCQGKLTDVSLLGSIQQELLSIRQQNRQLQLLFRRWATLEQQSDADSVTGTFLDQNDLPWMFTLNQQLTETMDDAALKSLLLSNLQELERVAAEIAALARAMHPDIDVGSLRVLDSAPQHFAAQWEALTGQLPLAA